MQKGHKEHKHREYRAPETQKFNLIITFTCAPSKRMTEARVKKLLQELLITEIGTFHVHDVIDGGKK